MRRLSDTPMSRQCRHHQPSALHAIAPDIQNRRVCARKRQRRANRQSARNRRSGAAWAESRITLRDERRSRAGAQVAAVTGGKPTLGRTSSKDD